MAFVKWFLIIIATLIAIILIAGFIMPTTITLERSVRIDAPKTTVFHTMNDFSLFNRWSPWHDLDPNIQYSFSDATSGEGAVMSWKSDNPDVGNGTQRIVKTTGTDLIELELEFDGFDGISNAWYALKDANDATDVTWGYSADLSSPYIVRFIAPMIRSTLTQMYDDGLGKLKVFIEETVNSTPALGNKLSSIAGPKISITHVERQTVVYTSGQSTFTSNDKGANLGLDYQTLIGFMNTVGLQQTGQPIAFTTEASTPDEKYVFEAAIPVANDTPVSLSSDAVKIKQTYSGPAVRVIYTGPYSGLGKAYTAADEYIKHNKITTTGSSWEQYVSDPGLVSEDELETYIYFPIVR